MDTARNLYQLNANEVPLTLHYGFALQDSMEAAIAEFSPT